MKKNSSYLLLLLFTCFQHALNAQIERVIVETYYIADALDTVDASGGKLDIGAVTYRVYVDLKPGNKLRKIYGDKNHALKFSSTQPFFNNIDGDTYAKDIKKGLYNQGTVPLDTWLTIGQTAAKTADGKANFGILKSQDKNGSFIGGPNNGGVLTNSASAVGIPLTTADGMFVLALPSYTWSDFFIKSIPSGVDSTIFGSAVPKSVFISNKALLENKFGVTGPVPDSNQVLVAQLTTAGKLEFELNIEVEQLVDTVPTIFKYVANGDTLVGNEKVSSYLKFPYDPICGCKDPVFLEYSAKYECSDDKRCINRVVYGCKDSLACNFDPHANFSTPFLCCYPGRCNGRDISLVCPQVMGDVFVCTINPNPAQNSIFLNVTSGVVHDLNYAIYDYSGTKILSEELGSGLRINNKEIELSGLSNGLYLIRVTAGNIFFNKQFIKN